MAMRSLVVAVILATTAAPVVTLAWRWSLVADLSEAIRTYRGELFASMGVCVGAGVLASVIGIAVVTRQRWRSVLLLSTLIPGMVPGALFGEAILAAYKPVGGLYDIDPLGDWGWWFYNHWLIVVVALAGRFAWVGVAAAWLAVRSEPAEVSAQAVVDGADGAALHLTVHLLHQWPTLLCGTFVAAALALADVAVVSLVEVPAVPMVSKILIEKFHKFETGMLVALSLWMMAAVLPGAILGVIVLRRRE
jgi:ABC-type Fe3+ transport system permease subunit